MAKFFDSCPSEDDSFSEPGLNVHRHDNLSGALVVFVHGWGGTGYGTWRGIPAAVYQRGSDVALVDYISGSRRRFMENPKLDGTVEWILDELNALATTYTKFVLVGHSMGGVVCAAVLRRSYAVGHGIHERTVGLMSIASPRAGLRRVPVAPVPIRDATFLAAHSDVHRDNFEFFSNLVDVTSEAGSNRRFHIPHQVALAAYDRWVNRMTSSGDLPRSSTQTFPAGHTGVLQLEATENWVCDNVEKFQEIWLEESRADPQLGQRRLVARFKGHSRHGEWQDAYQSALDEFGATERTLVYDDTAKQAEESLALMVRVLRCADLGTSELQSELESLARSHDSGEIQGLGISPFGPEPAPFADEILHLIGDATNRWIQGVSTTSALREEIVRWLRRLHPLVLGVGRNESISVDGQEVRRQGLAPGFIAERGVVGD